MTWAWNNDYKDLGQVEEFYPAYLAVYEELRGAGQYPYNDSFKGRIPGIEGPREDTAIYLLQKLRSVREMQAQIAAHRATGWRDVDPAELASGPVRFAGVAQYGWYSGGHGFQQWDNARLTLYGSGTLETNDGQRQPSMIVLQGRARTNGHLVAGKVLVKD